jgi:hypothetical protein
MNDDGMAECPCCGDGKLIDGLCVCGHDGNRNDCGCEFCNSEPTADLTMSYPNGSSISGSSPIQSASMTLHQLEVMRESLIKRWNMPVKLPDMDIPRHEESPFLPS